MSATLLDCPVLLPSKSSRVPEPAGNPSDPDLRAHLERALDSTYELDREIGRGGMGIVYRARDRRLKRLVAIKVLPPELAFRQEIRTRFLREAETAAQLNHPNIVPIYSVDEREGIVYFVMALVDGGNLAARLHDEGRLHPSEVRRIMLEVASALAYAHERGVVHRDIKPDNILIQREDGRVLVTDFGIARAVSEGADSRLTATGMAIGTPAYMSPEQSTGERVIDGRSDLYSLGVVGYQMLTGDPPFTAPSTPALLVKHLSEAPQPLATRVHGVPEDLERAVMLLLEKDPDNRFSSAAALVTALETGKVPPVPVPLAATAAPPVSRRAPIADAVEEWGDGPTREELARWNEPSVRKLRRQLGPYVIVNSVIILTSILFGTGLFFVTGIWSVMMAFRYAKLWSNGFDWHDVLQEPRERMFLDVAAEWFDSLRAVWDRDKRAEVRERNRNRVLRASGAPRALSAAAAPGLPRASRTASLSAAGRDAVRRAEEYRQDIQRWADSLSKRERSIVGDVPGTAQALFQKVQRLATMLADLERGVSPGSAEAVESEISQLEAQANPFDAGSEERIRRLAQLKRQRKAVSDLESRRELARSRMEECLLALENIRLDVLKLRAGSQTLQEVTLITDRARDLAAEVDNRLYVVDEMEKLRGGRESGIGHR